jgi:cell division protein FtsL
MKQARFYITLSVAAILVLSLVRVVITNAISTNGIDLVRIQEQIDQYKKDNSLLHEQVLALSSLTHVASVAGELGFVTSKTQLVISEPLPLALKQ